MSQDWWPAFQALTTQRRQCTCIHAQTDDLTVLKYTPPLVQTFSSKLWRFGNGVSHCNEFSSRTVTDINLTCTKFGHLFNSRFTTARLIFVPVPSMSVLRCVIEDRESKSFASGSTTVRISRVASLFGLDASIGNVSCGTRCSFACSNSPRDLWTQFRTNLKGTARFAADVSRTFQNEA